jgi:hypothetical protein
MRANNTHQTPEPTIHKFEVVKYNKHDTIYQLCLGQLENELAQNAWLSVAAQENIIFDTPPKDRYPAALKLLGIDPIMLTGAAGHA